MDMYFLTVPFSFSSTASLLFSCAAVVRYIPFLYVVGWQHTYIYVHTHTYGFICTYIWFYIIASKFKRKKYVFMLSFITV